MTEFSVFILLEAKKIMGRLESYIGRQIRAARKDEANARMAERIFFNVRDTKSLSDTALAIHRSNERNNIAPFRKPENVPDPVYRKLLEADGELMRYELDGIMRGVIGIYKHKFDIERRTMKKEVYDHLLETPLPTLLEEWSREAATWAARTG